MAGREGKLQDLESREEQRKLSKQELLRPRLIEEDVFVTSLGGTVTLRSISHEARQRIREQCGFMTEKFDEDKFTMLSLVESIIDPQLTVEDIEELRKQDASVIDELVVQVSTLNMLGRTTDLKKESETTPSLDLV
jgi:hypothetical protein